MILYILLISFFILLALSEMMLNKRQKNFFLITSMFVLFVLSGFRNIEIGNDTSVYVNLYESIARNPDLTYFLNTRFESGYIIYNFILANITSNPLFFLAITSSIIMIAYAYYIHRYSKKVMISVLLFLLCGFWADSMNIVRMQLAIILCLFSYSYIENKNLIKFLLCVLLAFFFHKTAIIFLVSYPLYHIKLDRKFYIASCIGIIFVYTYLNDFLSIIVERLNFYTDYTGTSYHDGSIRLATIVNTLFTVLLIILFLFIKQVKQRGNSNHRLTSLMELQHSIQFLVVTLGINILSFKFNLLDRCSDYFFVFIICFIPNAIETLESRNLRKVLYVCVISIFLLYFIVVQIYRPEWNHIYPYKFYWQS